LFKVLQDVFVELGRRLKTGLCTFGTIPLAFELFNGKNILVSVYATDNKSLWRTRQDHGLRLREDHIDVFDDIRGNERRVTILVRSKGIFVEVPEVDLRHFPGRICYEHHLHPGENQCRI
jgi:hypothetical protein